jgi:hypothetical protein
MYGHKMALSKHIASTPQRHIDAEQKLMAHGLMKPHQGRHIGRPKSAKHPALEDVEVARRLYRIKRKRQLKSLLPCLSTAHCTL